MSHFFSTSAYIFGLKVHLERMFVMWLTFCKNPLKGSKAEAKVESGTN